MPNLNLNSCSETIQSVIDELGGQNVDQDHFGDLYQDALTAKNQTTDQLILLKNQKFQAEVAERKQQVNIAINELTSYPSQQYCKSSAQISDAIKHLENYSINSDFFGDMADHALAIKERSLDQLQALHVMKSTQEKQEADRIKAEKEAEQKRIQEEHDSRTASHDHQACLAFCACFV